MCLKQLDIAGFFLADVIGGHLWFVPMLFGLYLLMQLLSPWAENATEREGRADEPDLVAGMVCGDLL